MFTIQIYNYIYSQLVLVDVQFYLVLDDVEEDPVGVASTCPPLFHLPPA